MNTKPPAKTGQILLVEDNWGDIVLIREAFSQSGLNVKLSVVTDGEEALAYLEGQGKYAQVARPDFVLLDINLPRMDGRVFLRRLRSHQRLGEMPVVVLTSSKLDSDMREMAELGISGYLVKPSDLYGFQEVVKRIGTFWRG